MTLPAYRLPVCEACATPVPAPADCCSACGSPLLASTRRVVTTLFADLTGYTELASTLDIEDVHRLVRPLMNGLRRICTELDGVVPAIEGDGFMAVFGARASREDDPQRAVLAAARMQRAVRRRQESTGPLTPALKVGINTGEVLVAPSWEGSGFSVSGDPVNVASRLCSLATPGSVLAARSVVELVPAHGWGDAAPFQLRNRAEPVAACELDWPRLEEDQVGTVTDWPSPWVARSDLQEQVQAQASLGPVLLVGEAGSGKSRLAEEWLGAGDAVGLLARCSSFGRAAAGGLVEHLARAVPAEAFGEVVLSLPPQAQRCLTRLRGEDVDSHEIDSPEDAVAAVVGCLVGLAQTCAVKVVLDDLQWCEPEDDALVVALAGTGLAVLMVSRPGGTSWELPLVEMPPMSGAELTAHVRNCLPGADDELVAVLAERTGGLPLYVEQYARLLLEDGVVARQPGGCRIVDVDGLSRLPVAMRLFVAARIDRLPEQLRTVLITASVLGDTVDLDLLRYLTGLGPDLGEAVSELVERGLLRSSGDVLDNGPVRFRHQVVRDVAYESMLLSHRAQLHRAAAEWYAVLPVVQLLEAEAEHLEAVVALGEADCDIVRRAVLVLTSFARSISTERTARSLAALDRAAALVDAHPGCAVDELALLTTRSQVLELVGREHEAFLVGARAVRLAQSQDDQALLAEAELAHGRAGIRVDAGAATASLDSAEQRFAQLGDGPALARVEWARAHSGTSLQHALRSYEKAFALAQQHGNPRLASQASQELAQLVLARDVAEGVRWRAAAEVLLRADDVLGRARLEAADVHLMLLRGDLEPAYPRSVDLVEHTRDLGAVQLHAIALLWAGLTATLTGRLEDAEEHDRAAVALAATRPSRHMELNAGFVRAVRFARSGRTGEALALVDELAERAPALGHPGFVREAHATRAEVLLSIGRFEEADVAAETAVALDLELEQPSYALRMRHLQVAARVAGGLHVPLSVVAQTRSELRLAGAHGLLAELARWLAVEELRRGFASSLEELPPLSDSIEGTALDTEVLALSSGRPELLVDAASTWAQLGTTVWQARALFWHSELTGTPHPEADELLEVLQAPAGVAETFRAQVRDLRG
ncbi:MAG: adenylate/guanylate cyclase domain-containing protein [Mycobacteriales bacterium]